MILLQMFSYALGALTGAVVGLFASQQAIWFVARHKAKHEH